MEILARAVGRRKEAVAQIQLVRGNGKFVINDKPAQVYLQNNSCSLICIKSPLEAALSLYSTDFSNLQSTSQDSALIKDQASNPKLSLPLQSKKGVVSAEQIINGNVNYKTVNEKLEEQSTTIVQTEKSEVLNNKALHSPLVSLGAPTPQAKISLGAPTPQAKIKGVAQQGAGVATSAEGGVEANVANSSVNTHGSSHFPVFKIKEGLEQSNKELLISEHINMNDGGSFELNLSGNETQNLNNASCYASPFPKRELSLLKLNNLVSLDEIDVLIKVKGGGLIGQAEAIKLGIARAFCLMQAALTEGMVKKVLKTKGYLTQDSRVKERRKYGLKKARKASQYHKR